MMQSRTSSISLVDMPYDHCLCCCVRRAFLCGEDQYSGQSFAHCCQLMVDRIRKISDIFAINICVYSSMSNPRS
ncbi:hypothetical protein [Psychromonas sp.]|uniref:hypothetical protein n=1 Tax=Psychromonas sp. TaxID=1884585 RepID=UPI0039E38805